MAPIERVRQRPLPRSDRTSLGNRRRLAPAMVRLNILLDALVERVDVDLGGGERGVPLVRGRWLAGQGLSQA
jgi:hypothetical protein